LNVVQQRFFNKRLRHFITWKQITVTSAEQEVGGASISANVALVQQNNSQWLMTVQTATDLTVSGIISGAFNITKREPEGFCCQVSNSYSGTTNYNFRKAHFQALPVVIADGSG